MRLSDFSKLELWIIGICTLAIIFLPALISLNFFPSPFDESSSWAGSAIGGISAPIVGLLSIVLLYITIKLQIQSTKDADTRQVMSSNGQILQLYYSSVKNAIDNYTYKPDEGIVCTGSDAIHCFFSDFYCDPHKFDDEHNNNSRITELKSILELFCIVLSNIETTNAVEKSAIFELTKHQFLYRVFPRLNMPEILDKNFAMEACSFCDDDHGLPPDFIVLINNIREKLGLC